MRSFKFSLLAAVCVGCLTAGALSAQASEADVLYRQNNMKLVGAHMKSIVAIVKGEVALKDQLATQAEGLAAAAAMSEAAFKAKAMEGKTTAKEDIWTNWEKFSGGLGTLKAEADKLAAAAKSGDMAAVGAQLGAVGKTCKGCHENFRSE